MKDKINFFVRFIVLTFVIFIVWIPLGEAYLLILAWVSKGVLWVMGYQTTLVMNEPHITPEGIIDPPFFLYYDIEHGMTYIIDMMDAHLANFNIVPLVALILVTPRIEPVKRIRMLVIGIFVLFCMHVIDFVAHFPMELHNSVIAELVVVFMAVGEVAVPFVVWFVLAHKEILGK